MFSRPRRSQFLSALIAGALIVSSCGGSDTTSKRSRNSALPVSVAPKFWSPVCASFEGLENRNLQSTDEIVVTLCPDASSYRLSGTSASVDMASPNRVLHIPASDLEVGESVSLTVLHDPKFTGTDGQKVENATVLLTGAVLDDQRFVRTKLIVESLALRNQISYLVSGPMAQFALQFLEINAPLWLQSCSNSSATYSPNDPRGFEVDAIAQSAIVSEFMFQAKLRRDRMLYIVFGALRNLLDTGAYDAVLCDNPVSQTVDQDQINLIRKYNADLDNAICGADTSAELIDGLRKRYQADTVTQSIDRRALMATDVSDSVALAASMLRIDFLSIPNFWSVGDFASSFSCPISRGSFQLGTDEIGEIAAFSNTTTTTTVPDTISPSSNGSEATTSTTLVPAPAPVNLKVGKTVATKAIIKAAALPLQPGFAAFVSIGKSSSKVCAITGGKVKMKAAGTCFVNVTAKLKKGTTKAALLKAKIITYYVTK